MNTRYLSVAEVIAIHDAIIERTGAMPEGLRDEGLLESALTRGQTAAHYENADLVRQAVLMAIGISQNQSFVDGNKRAAYAVLDIFLRLNGVQFIGDPVELARWIESIAERVEQRKDAQEQFENWLRSHLDMSPGTAAN